ncbi:endolytic transglycosylase MltG [Sphingomonas naphthae]|uniref:Endolytic murein transglycosylase n=1 Tax=Sphingomonas naphthae TaxID=1813468 RepID=A0ABY7TPR5_9SPHN|nr:endolytic transglycosylase MltG [Sphingomonas naphthae]WCT74622.1 endolytic transglycosylase MltG [Sphingomonas naphthae]
MARRRTSRKGAAVALIVAAALVVAAAVAGYPAWRDWYGPGPLDEAKEVTIPAGSTLAGAARALEKAGAIRSTTGFLRFARHLGPSKPIRAGEFEIPVEASGKEILTLLQNGKTLQRLVTIPEGMPSVMVVDRLRSEPLLEGETDVPEEGSVLPDSYSFEKGEARADVLDRMQAAMTKTLAELWDKRNPTTVVTTPREAIILASIVEKETGVASERRLVAAVYSNRLRMGMRLQADPTTIYPITRGRPLGRRIRRSELNAVNGYNTYAMAGLPQGPIANPGRESIAAVLDPAPSKALYFVASGKGGHVFADTLAQHNSNVQKFYALRRQRGEM